ncbi:peroxide stress protein YaaA [Daejeonella sp.]|uniref:peroxide stress protein YaaA n=1 Tax=Daejeonella sp. TaxID=2805397 RepID=UPI0025BBC4B5|nr:peroxide stress protein YaaA [Daejeonella sp.]
MKTVENIIISCSSQKSKEPGIKAKLADLSFDQLSETRNYLAERYIDPDYHFISDRRLNTVRHRNISRCLEWNNCLPAHSRYTGKVFSHIQNQNWLKAHNVLIVSPLFGIIKPGDKIPNYNLQMSDLLVSKKHNINIPIWRIWRPVLDELIHELSDGKTTFSLLFNSCTRGFSVDTRNSFESPVIQWRDNYGHHKGEWLNDYLSNR